MTLFNYQIVRKPRRKSVSISVRPDGSVRVLAPSTLGKRKIAELIEQKSKWIQNKIAHFEELQIIHKPKEYVSGESFYYLGKKYPLKLVEGSSDKGVKLKHGEFIVHLPPALSPIKQKISIIEQLSGWYYQHAGQLLGNKTSHFAKSLGLSPTLVGVKGYTSRWGSCHSDGRIYYNWRIIMAPPAIIDYLIVHELCHLVHGNHSKQFWQLVKTLLPDYAERRKWLRIHGYSLTI